MAGWTAYVLGTVLAGLGAAVVAVYVVRVRSRPRRSAAASAVGLAAVSMLAWPVVMIAGWVEAGVLDQLVVGLAWGLVGLTAVRRAAPAA